jgi:hypothetical protein
LSTNTRLFVVVSVWVLAGCPLAMSDDYVVQGVDVPEAATPVIDAGVPPPAVTPPVCVPATCHALGAECGLVDDGCGGKLICGLCKGTRICGFKTPFRCDRPGEN